MSKKKRKTSEVKQGKIVNPYKGLAPYKEEDEKLFCGRDEKKRDIIDSVKRNPLTVIYGKSGIGKTSLLNAGVFPGLREEGFLPVGIRLAYSESAKPLLGQMRETIKEKINKLKIEVKTQKEGKRAKPLNPDETLCDYFRRVSHFDPASNKTVILVLVFDQFEEFFTLGKAYDETEKRALIDEIKSLNEFRYRTEKRGGKKNNKKKSGLSTASYLSEVRIIISLREDYLPDFTELKRQTDIIDHGECRVTYLTKAQALKIVGMPGGFKEERIINEVLSFFSPDREENKKTGTISPIKSEIEPAFLSLLCFQLFEKKNLKSVTREDQNKILADFYDSEIRDFPDKVRKFVELKLLTKEGFRTPIYLEPNHKFRYSFEKLLNRRILRKFYEEEKEYFEITHDILVPVIKERRDRRAKKRRKTIVTGLLFIILFFVGTTWFALVQKSRTTEKSKILRELNLSFEAKIALDDDNTRAIQIAEAAYEMGLPNPEPWAYQVLSAAAYSSFEKPFYSTMLRHAKKVNNAVLSPDNKLILTACDDVTAKLWGVDSKLLKTFQHTKSVNSAVFSPNGKRILTASWDRSARLWNLEGELLEVFEHEGVVETATFSPDGALVLTASRDGTAKLWSLTGEAPIIFPFGSHIFSARFSDDGTRILTASWSKGVKLWNPAGQLLQTLNHDGTVISALFLPGSSEVMTASQDGVVKWWSPQGEITENLTLNSGLTSVVFSPTGDRILTGSKDGKARIWSLQGQLIEEIQFDGELSSAVFTSDGSQILTASSAGIAKLSYLKNNILVELAKHNSELNKALFSPNGDRVLTTSHDGTAKLWDIEGKLLASLQHEGNVNDAAFSSTGDYIVTASEDRTAKLWTKSGELIRTFKHDTAVSSAVFSPDEKMILTSSRDNIGALWDKDNDKKPLETISDYDDKESLYLSRTEESPIFYSSSALFSPDGEWIMTTSFSDRMRLRSTKGKDPINFSGHTGRIYSAVFSHDGSRILTASEDGTARLWDMNGTQLKSFNGHKGAVYSARFSKDDRLILTASEDGTAKLWCRDGKPKVVSFNKHKKAVLLATFSHDDRRIITASEDGTAKLWDFKGNLLADLDKHTGAVVSAVFSKDGQRILTASKDGTAKIWYTPEAIYRWLEDARIPKLSEDEKKKLGIL